LVGVTDGDSGLADRLVEAAQNDLALAVLESANKYEETLEKMDQNAAAGDLQTCIPLVAEYYVLRTTLVMFLGKMTWEELTPAGMEDKPESHSGAHVQ
jgi:hypothetical protein